MVLLTRIILILALVLPLNEVSAQETPIQAEATNTTTTASRELTPPPAATSQSSQQTRQQFNALLRESPTELGTILALDPTLLSTDAFLAGYPELASFVAAHPEVRRNPRYFLQDFNLPDGRGGVVEQVMEGLSVFSVFLLITFALAWLVRTIIEQKRWNRLSRTQSEVHNKILDRFSTSDELIAYVRSPAGAKFLESAPIPLHAEQATQNMPLTRVLWSIQFGVIVVAGALGLLLVSGRFDAESSKEMFAMGVIGLCIGGGFIASALVSLALSRRLGLWQGAPSAQELAADDAGPVR